MDARHVMRVPEGLSLVEAAAIPEVYATAWLNLFRLARLQPGEKVLLHAGASGVGSAAIQLCKASAIPAGERGSASGSPTANRWVRRAARCGTTAGCKACATSGRSTSFSIRSAPTMPNSTCSCWLRTDAGC